MSTPEILIVGATGKVGTELVSLLSGAGTACRALTRDSSRTALFQDLNVEVVCGDLNNRDDISAAVKGISQIFLLTRDHPRQANLEGNLIAIAKQEGVTKIVKSSAFAAGLQPPVGYGVTHAESERLLMESGLQWVILRPYMFMQNFLEIADSIKSGDLIPMPLGKAGIGLVDARDVALAATRVLLEGGHEDRIYELTGPESLTMADCAEVFSTALGREIRYRSPPYWLTGLIMRAQGVSAWDVSMRKQLFRMISEGGEARLTDDVQRLTGRSPRSLQTFIQDYQKFFVI